MIVMKSVKIVIANINGSFHFLAYMCMIRLSDSNLFVTASSLMIPASHIKKGYIKLNSHRRKGGQAIALRSYLHIYPNITSHLMHTIYKPPKEKNFIF